MIRGNEQRERITHSELSHRLVAPIPSYYREQDQGLVDYEHFVFDNELHIKAAVLGKTIKDLVSLQLLPASMVVMEEFSQEYARTRTTGEKRRQRMSQVYQLGSVIGLAASSFVYAPDYPEEVHPETVTSIAKNQLITCDTPSEEVVANIDYKVKKIVNTVAEHLSSDRVEESQELTTATKTGYYVGRSLAELTIKQS